MIDPVMQDLDRYLAREDEHEYLDLLREENPETYGHLSDDELARELQVQAEDIAAENFFEESSW